MSPDLPKLSTEPQHLADCCLSLSSHLLARLSQLLPSSGLCLSIGSGTGLLEALLQKHIPHSAIEGVEVSAKVNKYLPSEQVNVVGGTWDLSSKASHASALMFVYPREPKLVTRYLEIAGGAVRRILWMGPRVDWPDYEAVLLESEFSTLNLIDDSGLASYEMLVLILRHQQEGTDLKMS
jgi:hypothetical protein